MRRGAPQHDAHGCTLQQQVSLPLHLFEQRPLQCGIRQQVCVVLLRLACTAPPVCVAPEHHGVMVPPCVSYWHSSRGAMMSSRRTTAATSAVTLYGQIPVQHWSYPAWVTPEEAAAARRNMQRRGVLYGGSESYHHMCRRAISQQPAPQIDAVCAWDRGRGVHALPKSTAAGSASAESGC